MKKVTFKLIGAYIFAVLVVVIFFYALFLSYFQNRIFPGVKISQVELGGQTKESAYALVNNEFQVRQKNPLKIVYQNQQFGLNLADSQPQINLQEKIEEAYLLGRSGNFFLDFTHQILALTSYLNLPLPGKWQTLSSPKETTAKINNPVNLTLTLTYQKKSFLDQTLQNINKSMKVPAVNAKVIPNDPLTITPSQEGQELDQELLFKQLEGYLTLLSSAPSNLPIKTSLPAFSTSEAETAKAALENVVENPLKLHFQNSVWSINQAMLFSILDFNPERLDKDSPQSLIDNKKLSAFLQQLSPTINQEAKDARFTFNPGSKKVSEFQAAQEGREVDVNQTATLITQALTAPSASSDIDLPVRITRPKIATADINSFGIEELIAQGISHFSGSIDNRIYNIKLAASKINGVLVAPGENFSFNNIVGDISAATGFKQAYIIKSGRTVLDDGGGVCQVSTTVFRAALNAGVPIVERTAHAYRVGYYEQGFPPGLDATIFHPSVDLKFKNDTPGYILIQTKVIGTTLYVDLYGTKDGRIVNLTKSQILSQTPPLPEIRQDDPTLPRGTVKQVDWAAWGANVIFKRTVTRDGETIIDEAFRSNYRPWQAVYLVGTKDN